MLLRAGTLWIVEGNSLARNSLDPQVDLAEGGRLDLDELDLDKLDSGLVLSLGCIERQRTLVHRVVW